jgi:acetyl esterase/lipase
MHPAPRSRRQAFTAVATAALAFTLVVSAAAADWVPLWPDGAPGGANPATVSESERNGRLTDTATPAYELHRAPAAASPAPAVVIFPGGGYQILALGHEGRDYARWLNERGITAIVVKYRVSGDDRAGFRFPVPLLDARRAIRTARANAAEWGLDPEKIGVMGSSAGGHLAAMAATSWADSFTGETADAIDRESCRPDFAILVYPVISMSEPWGHGGSKRRLLGPDPDPELAASVSADLRVDADTPPCFLVHAADDGAVPPRNSLEFAARCAEHRVPANLTLTDRGGHGFGLRAGDSRIDWPRMLESWLTQGVRGE